MTQVEYGEVVIRVTRKMPPTSLHWLKQRIQDYCDTYTPKIPVRVESIPKQIGKETQQK